MVSGCLYGANTFSAECARDDITVRQRYNLRRKSVLVALVLLGAFGYLGIHRFYSGLMTSGVVMLSITALCAVTLGTWLSTIGLVAVGAWCLVDICVMPNAIAAYNRRLMISLGH